ncbi:MAG: amidohydrolase family protein [Propionicimonas sp.]
MVAVRGRDVTGRPIELAWEAGRITRVSLLDAAADRLPFLLPGLVDLQVNGFAGIDLNADGVSAAEVEAICVALAGQGTTGFLPTVITGPPRRMLTGIRAVRAAVEAGGLARQLVLGIHLEGPFISAGEGMRGAHDPDWIRDPDLAELDEWRRAAGDLPLLITLAPERKGAPAFIRAAVERSVTVAIGHCLPTVEQCRAAIDAGARLATHLGNGLPAQLPRHPNHLWTLLADDRVQAGLIADGDHLPVDTFVSMVRAKSPARCHLVSDSAALAHCPPGEYLSPIGGRVTVAAGGSLRMTGTPYLAGSGRTLLECVHWALRHAPLPAADLVAMASRYPAQRVAAAGRGVLAVGARADLLVLEQTGTIEVRLAGEPVATLPDPGLAGLLPG